MSLTKQVARRCLVECTVTTLSGHTPGLVSPEPGIEVGRSLVSEPQTPRESDTGYAEHDLPPAVNGVMSWSWMSQSRRDPLCSLPRILPFHRLESEGEVEVRRWRRVNTLRHFAVIHECYKLRQSDFFGSWIWYAVVPRIRSTKYNVQNHTCLLNSN